MTNKLAGLLGKKTPPTESNPVGAQERTTEATETAPVKKPGLAGLKIAATPKIPTPAPKPKSAAVPATELTLDDLEESEDPGSHRPTVSQFADETPADKPLRDLESAAEGVDGETRKGMAQFAQLIDGVYTILDDPEMLGNVIRSIMIELKSNPQYMKLVADDDIRVWIRAMRANMGLQKIAKETKTKTRGKSSSANIDMDMLADLESFGDLD